MEGSVDGVLVLTTSSGVNGTESLEREKKETSGTKKRSAKGGECGFFLAVKP